jgi:hypothetical protein
MRHLVSLHSDALSGRMTVGRSKPTAQGMLRDSVATNRGRDRQPISSQHSSSNPLHFESFSRQLPVATTLLRRHIPTTKTTIHTTNPTSQTPKTRGSKSSTEWEPALPAAELPRKGSTTCQRAKGITNGSTSSIPITTSRKRHRAEDEHRAKNRRPAMAKTEIATLRRSHSSNSGWEKIESIMLKSVLRLRSGLAFFGFIDQLANTGNLLWRQFEIARIEERCHEAFGGVLVKRCEEALHGRSLGPVRIHRWPVDVLPVLFFVLEATLVQEDREQRTHRGVARSIGQFFLYFCS